MEILKQGNVIEVEGVIKTINDANRLNEVIKDLNSGNSVIIKIKDSFAMPSAVIGLLIKKVNEGVNIKVEVGSEILYELLDDLNLTDKFNVKKI
jgi:hypothetical protein